MNLHTSTKLECGRDLIDLVGQVTDGDPVPDPAHQAECPYCQEALCRIRTANSQLRSLAGEHVQVPRGLARRVMAQLRRERGRVPLGAGPLGVDTATDLVVIQIVRRAARSVEGVRQCSITLEPATADGDLAITIHLTALLGPPLPELADQVRDAVVSDLRAMTGLNAADVAIEIDDVELT